MSDPLDNEIADPLDAEISVPAVTVTPKPDTFLNALGRSVVNVATAPVQAGKALWKEVSSLPGNLARVKEIDPASLVNPGILKETAQKTLVEPVAAAAPEIIGGTLGGILGGPAGAVGGSSIARGALSMADGKPAPAVVEDVLTTLGVSALSSAAPVAAKFLAKAPGRYLSMPAERHAAGAAMMERIPERFGVTDADVQRGYANAETLAAQPPVATAPLNTLTSAVDRMVAQTTKNPLPSLQDTPLLKTLIGMQGELGEAGPVNAGQVNALVKGINHKIGSTTGAEKGMWKQLLGAVHEDMRSAATTTGDPAYQAFSDAIRKARDNFLRQDLAEAVNAVGVRFDRPGQSVISSPGKLKQWMQTNPEWVAAVEQAKPGLLDAIRGDIAEIVPVTDIVGRSIPGQRFGSGRVVLGGAAGHLLSRGLGMSPGTAESIGALLSGLSPQMGIRMSPGYVERSFAPVSQRPSLAGAVAGAVGARVNRDTPSPYARIFGNP